MADLAALDTFQQFANLDGPLERCLRRFRARRFVFPRASYPTVGAGTEAEANRHLRAPVHLNSGDVIGDRVPHHLPVGLPASGPVLLVHPEADSYRAARN